MKSLSEKQASIVINDALADLFNSSSKSVQVKHTGERERHDFEISVNGYHFIAEYKSHSASGVVAKALQKLNDYQQKEKKTRIPLLVVPYMGKLGSRLCEESGISWLDLSGNARIVASGIRIIIQGRPNKFIERGRPPNVFAPKSSRIVRQLLQEPRKFQAQTELARRSKLDDGYVSKIIRRLEQEQFVEANSDRAWRPCDPDLLLDAWSDAYDMHDHRVIQGHVPERTGEDGLRRLSRVVQALAGQGLDSAEVMPTGLAAAWQYTRFAAFRLLTIYMSKMPSVSFLHQLEFEEEPRGANFWIVIPNDESVFFNAREEDGIFYASPIQTYLDLKSHPERAREAAEALRKKYLNWEPHEK